jgi:hypothetical protein
MIEGMELAPHTKGLLPFCWSAPFCPEELIRQHTEHLERWKLSSGPAADNGAVRYEA